jgi:hypothetical protein
MKIKSSLKVGDVTLGNPFGQPETGEVPGENPDHGFNGVVAAVQPPPPMGLTELQSRMQLGIQSLGHDNGLTRELINQLFR